MTARPVALLVAHPTPITTTLEGIQPMAILPLAPQPFTAPTDRDLLPSERRRFVQTHRTCVFGYGRRNDGPSMSIVYYVPDDSGMLYIATMAGRAKAAAIARSGKASLCVLDESWPFTYLQVYCNVQVERDPDLVCDVMMGVAWRMSGQPLAAEARPMVDAMRRNEDRVVLACMPYATFATPPRHLHRNDQQEKLTHWLSGSVPWAAADPA